MVTLFGSLPPVLAVPISRRPHGVAANAETELLPALTLTTIRPSRDTAIECPDPSAPPMPPVGYVPAGVSDPSPARVYASIALPAGEFVMVYTAPARPGPSSARAAPGMAATPPATVRPTTAALAASAFHLFTGITWSLDPAGPWPWCLRRAGPWPWRPRRAGPWPWHLRRAGPWPWHLRVTCSPSLFACLGIRDDPAGSGWPTRSGRCRWHRCGDRTT